MCLNYFSLSIHLLKIGKFDTETKEMLYWNEDNCWPSELVFIPRPNGGSEDDGEKTVWWACTMYDIHMYSVLCMLLYTVSDRVQMDGVPGTKIRSLIDYIFIGKTVY